MDSHIDDRERVPTEGEPTWGQTWSLLHMLARRKPGRQREPRRSRVQDLDTHEGNEYPVLALPETVVFPNLVTPLFLGRDRTSMAVEAAG